MKMSDKRYEDALQRTTACPNVTGRTKEGIAPKASGLVLVRSPLLTSYKWRDLILRRGRGQGNIHFPCSADHEQD